ncbi:MAG: hypothetical protein AAF264_10535 [Pseudomonadota bacterium]
MGSLLASSFTLELPLPVLERKPSPLPQGQGCDARMQSSDAASRRRMAGQRSIIVGIHALATT